MHLLWDKKFWPLCGTQFFGAFNDNFFKNALVILITFKTLSLNGVAEEKLIAFSAGVFIFPFFLFSALGGQLADKYEKSRLMVFIKVGELAIMLLAVAGFFIKSLAILLIALFLMGLQSALFSPLKYGYLPQKLGTGTLGAKKLTSANALLQSTTFLAILLGTLFGALLVAVPEKGIFYVCGGLISFALIGLFFSLFILKAPAGKTYPAKENGNTANLTGALKLPLQGNVLISTYQLLHSVLQIPTIRRTLFLLAWFWFYGSMLLALLPIYGKKILNGNEQVVTFLLTLFSIGIGMGCITCAYFVNKNILYREDLKNHKFGQAKEEANSNRIGIMTLFNFVGLKEKRGTESLLVFFGSIGLSVFLLDLFWQSLSITPVKDSITWTVLIQNVKYLRISLDLLMIAFCGGLLFVPLMTFLQKSIPTDRISRVIAGSNILDAIFMVLSALVLILLFQIWALSVVEVFLVLSVLNGLVCVGLALRWSA